MLFHIKHIYKIILILAFFGFSLAEENVLKKARNSIAEINIAIFSGEYPSKSNVSELKNHLLKLIEPENSKKYSDGSKNYKEKKGKTVEFFNIFEKKFNKKVVLDSLKNNFLLVNNNFNSVYGSYFLEELFKTNKKKLIVFSTSVSCECTLEMCYQQEAEVQKFCKENNYDYAVIDTWEDFEIQQKFKVGFVPTVIFLDSENNELKRFVRDDNLFNELNNY